MNIIFLGTPDFAVPALKAIIASRHKVLAAVTQPDKPVGRKQEITPSPVKIAAENNGIKVLQYNKIRLEGVNDLKALNADIMVTCAYGQILSQEIIDICPKGIINIHASLLPKYRGAAPIQYAVLNGDKETGVTVMQTEAGIDTGDILAVSKTAIGENETAGELFDRLSEIGAELIVKTLDKIENGEIIPIKQDSSKASNVKMIKKENAEIDFTKTDKTVFDFVRGMNPWPVAYTFLNGKLLKIYKVEKSDKNGEAGTVINSDIGGITVACGNGSVIIKELQLEGGKRMSAHEFLLGRKIPPLLRLGK